MIENWPSSHNRDEQRDRAKVSRRESVRGASTTSANRRGCWPRPTSCARSGTDHDGGSHPSPAIAEELEAIAAALKAGDLEDSRAINKLGSRAVRAGIELGRFGDDLWRNRVGLDG